LRSSRKSLYRKLLYAFLILSFSPMLLLVLSSLKALWSTERILRDNTVRILDTQAEGILIKRAETEARKVADLLKEIEDDLHDLSLILPKEQNYLSFVRNHNREVWYRGGSNAAPIEIRESIPLYSEATYIGPDGRERLRIGGGIAVDSLRDVSQPANTTYLTEDYFLKARDLPPGKFHVTHLTGWHVNRDEQLGGALSPETAIEGRPYRGIVRFAAPVHDSDGNLKGVVVLSLDHRHLMEFTQHILPEEDRLTVFPSYDSGNYAFMFDDEGWMITHPKYWDIRGLNSEGTLLLPYTQESSPDDVAHGNIPFNLLYAGFIHPNYPFVAKEVFAGKSGVIDVTNVGGARKIMAYAPIRYNGGGYEKRGIFGGITIGAELQDFRTPALAASESIGKEFSRFLWQTGFLIFLATALIFFGARRLTGDITAPLLRLIEGTREMARGRMAARVDVDSGDEVGDLADSFNTMASELELRRNRLLKTLRDLRRSRRMILRERDAKETIAENIETGVLVLEGDGRVSSVNGPARKLLALSGHEELPASLESLLPQIPETFAILKDQLEQLPAKEKWSRYITIDTERAKSTWRIAILPFERGTEQGRILTIEDLTERVQLRERLARMERLASLGRLSAGIAHEVRNPLTGISLLLDDLHDRLHSLPEDRTLIRRALDEIGRLENLVSELLDFSAVSSANLLPGNIEEVLDETVFLIRKQCQRSSVSIEREIAPELPGIAMDRGKIKQVFLNILTNALDAMPQGGLLSIRTTCDLKEVRVIFRDTGNGIPPEHLPLIFEPFYTTRGEGNGLGLAITHNIVAEHGGRIEVRSTPGEGSVFTLFFPAVVAASETG